MIGKLFSLGCILLLPTSMGCTLRITNIGLKFEDRFLLFGIFICVLNNRLIFLIKVLNKKKKNFNLQSSLVSFFSPVKILISLLTSLC